MRSRAPLWHIASRGCRWVLAAQLLALLLTSGCGPEMSFTLELDQCDDRLALVQVWLFRPVSVDVHRFCRLTGPESIGPDAELDLGRFAVDPGMTVRVIAVGRSSLSSQECICAGVADKAVSDGGSYTLELRSDYRDCTVPQGQDCD